MESRFERRQKKRLGIKRVKKIAGTPPANTGVPPLPSIQLKNGTGMVFYHPKSLIQLQQTLLIQSADLESIEGALKAFDAVTPEMRENARAERRQRNEKLFQRVFLEKHEIQEIRKLRESDPGLWSLQVLALKYNVHPRLICKIVRLPVGYSETVRKIERKIRSLPEAIRQKLEVQRQQLMADTLTEKKRIKAEAYNKAGIDLPSEPRKVEKKSYVPKKSSYKEREFWQQKAERNLPKDAKPSDVVHQRIIEEAKVGHMHRKAQSEKIKNTLLTSGYRRSLHDKGVVPFIVPPRKHLYPILKAQARESRPSRLRLLKQLSSDAPAQ